MIAILDQAGHSVRRFFSITDFLRASHRETFDLILFDWHMAGRAGIELLAHLRTRADLSLPAVAITDSVDAGAVAEALNAGADDCVCTPIEPCVLLARLSAVTRRSLATPYDDEVISVKGVTIKLSSGQVWRDGREIVLRPKEIELAAVLFSNIGRPLSRGYLLEAVWGNNPNVATRTIDQHMASIRKKLQLGLNRTFRIMSLYGYGYRLERHEGRRRTAR